MSIVTKHIPKHILYVDGVTKSFDGFKALNSLSFTVKPGELRAIIGPNGAGKTTMMDVITGKLKPDEGDVFFRDSVDLTKFDEADIANMGIGRKFQKPTVIESLTVFENLELALSGNRNVFKALFHKLNQEQMKRIDETIELVGLSEKRQWLGGNLSHGQKQWLEIGMLLNQNPDLLLVDEPAAGMTDHETELTAKLLRDISGEHSVVVVEHDMEFIKALDCPVTVLHEGHVLAEGTLEQVQKNEQVIEVYLGR
ncbi:MAG: urea ABC transporter ATP-binding protein UrtD [Ketobacter sp.]|uniref:urea ABC transporter ATP-binding protein UrtD n=1 Tax=Ketobacter sp. MCCC 1A13808 TaxID=2602738 RepID=UPI0012EB9099|nr:urea ABC transporter ATP-binding protein UrtD [Ketobacter sp. MCCC 1A13808]